MVGADRLRKCREAFPFSAHVKRLDRSDQLQTTAFVEERER